MNSEQRERGGSPQRHGINRGHGMKPEMSEEQQLSLPISFKEDPTDQLMERIADSENLKKARLKVKANKGSPGIDGMTTQSLEEWMMNHEATLQRALLEGRYTPQPVKGVQIPKSGGGVRQLGIPTVIDRMIQQAILQVLEPLFDPTFSEHSYGFRAKKSAHQALKRAAEYVEDGRNIVVDIDLEKFFDRVNHDILMGKLAKRIKDGRLLRLIRRYLQAGMMNEGVCVAREEGTPQGGPLSPLLANFLLDDLDKELEKRGHRFCRYADDCNIYVRTMEAGNRVMESITGFLEKKLKLKVNREKSCVAQTMQRKFLGYRIYKKGLLTIAPQSVERLKEKIRNMTPRRIAKPLKEVAQGLGPLLRGWMGYFRLIEGRNKLVELDGWIRRRMRAIRLQQLKRPRTVAQFLQEQGVLPALSWITATSGKGKWRLSKSQGVHRGMRDKWLESLGLESLVKLREELTGNLKETAVYENVRTVV